MMVLSPNTLDAETEVEQQRALLFGVAYRMLGSAAEAEDMVQDAQLRLSAVPAGEIRNQRSYLVTVITRLCLDHMKSARIQREQYVGPWLPEPVLTTDDDWRIALDAQIDLRESVSMAFLVMLESLDPVERAVLILHDVFDYKHAEIAEVVGKPEATCRQLLKRARDRLANRPRRNAPSLAEQRRLAQQFFVAASTGDVVGLVEMLAADASAYSDGGGKVASAVNGIFGAERVARFACMFPRKERGARFELREVNGQQAVLSWLDERLTNVFVFGFDGDKIATFYVQRNPDKLRRLRQTLPRSAPTK